MSVCSTSWLIPTKQVPVTASGEKKKEKAECEVDIAVLFLTAGCFSLLRSRTLPSASLLGSLVYEWHPEDSPLPVSLDQAAPLAVGQRQQCVHVKGN